MKNCHEVRETMCETCPFRTGSKFAKLRPALATSALSEASRVCHSTGTNAISGRTGKPSRLCRGARNMQLAAFHATGFLPAPTDEAWAAKWAEMQLQESRSKAK